MIAQTLTALTNEITGLWSWIIGIVAGWGLTLTAVVAAIIYAHIRINRAYLLLQSMRNQMVAEDRELSFRLTKLEK
jgi:uncharacterized membrane protein (DUF4010 family)